MRDSQSIVRVNTLILDSYLYEPLKKLPTVTFDPKNLEHQLAYCLLSDPNMSRQHSHLRFEFDSSIYTNVVDHMRAELIKSAIHSSVFHKTKEINNGLRVVGKAPPSSKQLTQSFNNRKSA